MITDNITNEQLHNAIAWSRRGRTLRADAVTALNGNKLAREAVADAVRHYARSLNVFELADAIERYLTTDWSDGRDPSKLGALNAVSYIGERVAAIYQARINEILNPET